MTFLRSESLEELKKKKKAKPVGISLFSGAGGFDLGFAKAGLETRVMVEMDKSCCATLRANFTRAGFADGTREIPEHIPEIEPAILQRDICTLSTKEILDAGGLKVGEATFVIGGPPCQGFSTAGQRMIDDPRNKLYKEFVRVVRESLPRFFVFENVPGITSMKKGEIIKQICSDFAACGYNIAWDILNAADYGVPQIRRRVFIIGFRIDVMRLPEEGNPQLHMGAIPGKIKHPAWFCKRYGMPEPGQLTLQESKSPTTFIELLQKLNNSAPKLQK